MNLRVCLRGNQGFRRPGYVSLNLNPGYPGSNDLYGESEPSPASVSSHRFESWKDSILIQDFLDHANENPSR
jgi:hypothetical protein